MHLEQEVAVTDVLEAVRSCRELSTFPSITAGIVSLCQRPDADIDDIASLIGTDPALAAKILKIANSALFACGTPIMGLRRAVVRLGLRMTRMVVMSFALASSTYENAPRSFDFERFWKHALVTGCASKLLCTELGFRERDEALALGLLQDLGVLTLHFALREDYEKVLAESAAHPGDDLWEIEGRLLGTTHMEVGGFLLKEWGLPPDVHVPIEHHHLPERIDAPDMRRMGNILQLAAYVGKLFLEPAKGVSQAKIGELARRHFDLDEDRLTGILQAVEEHLRDMAELFSIDADSIPTFEEVSKMVALELAEMAMESEADRIRMVNTQEQTHTRLVELERRNTVLEEIAVVDKVTGVMNRASLDMRLQEEFAHAHENGGKLAVIMVDVDDFKRINDDLGHRSGDGVLQELGKYFRSVSRRRDVVGRYGGEEFLVVMHGSTPEGVEKAWERIREGVERDSVSWMPGTRGITISIGGVFVRDVSRVDSLGAIIDTADKCLYAAKGNGKNCARHTVM